MKYINEVSLNASHIEGAVTFRYSFFFLFQPQIDINTDIFCFAYVMENKLKQTTEWRKKHKHKESNSIESVPINGALEVSIEINGHERPNRYINIFDINFTMNLLFLLERFL